jgi:hypothetical protein
MSESSEPAEVEGHIKRNRNEGAPVEDEGRVRRTDVDDDGPEVEGHGLITDAMRAKRDPEAKRDATR